MTRLVAGAATAVIAMSIGASAYAQSTAGQAQEVIVTGARAARSTAGLAVQVNDAKDEAIVTKQFIETQVPSANLAQLINMVPGVSYSTEDPGGFNSGDLRIHGFDGNHVAVVLDGVPLNDTGNYAVYPGEYVIGEQIERITVNIGSSDVDSPSASALGATINITTKTPPSTYGVMAKASGGSYGYGRFYGEIDSGTIGPWGTKAMIGGEYGREDNFENRPGDNKRWNINGKVYQPLNGSDFISLSGLFTSERQFPAFRLSPSQITSLGRYYYGDNYKWVPEVAQPGKADSYLTGVTPTSTSTTPGVLLSTGFSSDSNYYALFPNPVDFGIIHGQSKFTLGHGLTFTFDPSFFYTLANGGGGTTLNEFDKRLIGNATSTPASNSKGCVVGGKVTGVDLNGDGDCLDTVVAYAPSNTQTYRWGLTSSLLWDITEQHHLQLSYTYDLGLHRQTGEYTTVDPTTGQPNDVFGARPGYGTPILTADGAVLQNRNRRSVAELNQISANYIGKFLDDKLHVNIGLRAPFFSRSLNQYCYTYNGTSATCDGVDPAKVTAAYNSDKAGINNSTGKAEPTSQGSVAGSLAALLPVSPTFGVGGVPNFRFPFKQDFDFNKVLPNAGITYRLAENHLFYASYAKGFSAPKTDDLYVSGNITIQPETSDNYSVGYRYQTRNLNVSLGFYDTEYQNRIVQSIDPNDPTSSIDRNVGAVRVDGVDLEIGWTPIEHLHVYGSANWNDSELKSNINVATSSTTAGVVTYYNLALPTKGKELVLTPDQIYSARISYDFGPLTVGFQGKYLGDRYISDTNDAKIGGYATFGFDARYTLPYFNGQSYVQLNVSNMFNRYYLSRSTTFNNGTAIPILNAAGATVATYTASTPAYYIGAPSTFVLTVGTRF
jgi:iron complex outermembrane receptor protein